MFAKRKFKASLGALILLLAVGWGYWHQHQSNVAVSGSPVLNTATVERRDFVRTLRVHGIVEAVQAYTVTAPRLSGASSAGSGGGPLVVTTLIRSGTLVKKGDLLVEFDRQGQMRAALDRRAEFLDLEQQIAKKQADHQAARAKDESELKQAENAVEKASLDMQKNEIVSRIDADKIHSVRTGAISYSGIWKSLCPACQRTKA